MWIERVDRLERLTDNIQAMGQQRIIMLFDIGRTKGLVVSNLFTVHPFSCNLCYLTRQKMPIREPVRWKIKKYSPKKKADCIPEIVIAHAMILMRFQ
ncbi:50S rRNA methyltransferase [Yersinia pestis]|nr:ribosomal RNA large subunit methyltransferase F domain protein [Yersinia pestis PY-36]EIT40047.1 ribosomal RNA large subunit methyltransferase F domain protein [Yersinia pestis PY-99]PVF19705.1 50S rRNA methyltransferase [Yersinia pestis]